ncbi:MAG: hypothetical protein AB7R89_33570 [Dehalococcoidia bacterium]
MTNDVYLPGHHPPGTTTGTLDRPPYPLIAPVMSLNFAREIARLRAEPAWLEGDRNTKTLIKAPDMRAVLSVMKPGARLSHHQTGARLTLQVLSGRLRLQLCGTTAELGEAEMIALDPAIRHGVEALEESAFLLTLVWPAAGHEQE